MPPDTLDPIESKRTVGKPRGNGLDFPISTPSDTPPIPDFEILGRVGGGAYGEVYLARSVTGMYRAVKVVRREDFEYERTFEREFEGIQHYEQVSQDHPGLVDVLHIGRDRKNGFYYYVMELADDEHGAHRDSIDPDAYKPKTLSSELRNRPNRSVSEVVKLGISLAGALGHLHQAGLTHRDVKPSNIIFVKGVPKLADVGLVARDGQRTYVGTEGYVPPEGPGTSAADLYSLAMVLYELHTNKDRLDFPELPTNLEIPPTVNRDEWRSLNAVICRAGSPDPRKRYDNAHAFALALRQVLGSDLPAGPARRRQARERRGGGFGRFVATTLLLLLLGAAGAGYWLWKDNKDFFKEYGALFAQNTDPGPAPGPEVSPPPIDGPKTDPEPPEEDPNEEPTTEPSDSNPSESAEAPKETPPLPPEESDPNPEKPKPTENSKGKENTEEPATLPETIVTGEDPPIIPEVVKGTVEIMSEPSGATVWIDGEEIGRTKTRPLEFPPGPVEFVLKHPNYRDTFHRAEVVDGYQLFQVPLLPDLGPLPGNPWINSLGLEFVATGAGNHETKGPVSMAVFEQFLEETGLPIPVVGRNGVAHVRDDQAVYQFCDWMTKKDRSGGYLGTDQYFRPLRPADEAQGDSFYCRIDNRFGSLLVNSEPEGAEVVINGETRGTTPVAADRVRFGPYRIEFRLPGYAVAETTGVLEDSEAIALPVQSLTRDSSIVFGASWTNTQGMPLIPVGDLMVAAFETRVSDYREYITASGAFAMPSAGFSQALNHPVVGITRSEAEQFCEWLTRKERAANMIRPWQSYRLPTDLEWSRFAGEPNPTGATPAERSRDGHPGFPWGDGWPPPEDAGNLADLAATPEFGQYVIGGYNDGYTNTAPVGSFPAAASGLSDVCGNVWEWVSDSFDGNDSLQVVRGGGWDTHDRDVLRISYRNAVPTGSREGFVGFRYILDDSSSQ